MESSVRYPLGHGTECRLHGGEHANNSPIVSRRNEGAVTAAITGHSSVEVRDAIFLGVAGVIITAIYVITVRLCIRVNRAGRSEKIPEDYFFLFIIAFKSANGLKVATPTSFARLLPRQRWCRTDPLRCTSSVHDRGKTGTTAPSYCHLPGYWYGRDRYGEPSVPEGWNRQIPVSSAHRPMDKF